MSAKLDKEDQNRVDSCEYYLKTKNTIENMEVYKDLSVGEVYFIKRKNYQGEEEYVTGGWNDEPAKYMVFHKDGGFVFVKRIIASGKMGKEVSCLTTEFDTKTYWLEADPDYVNSILLDNEDAYDPLAAEKKNSSNKNKARRKNKKIQLIYDTPQEAYTYIKSLKVGDTIYDTTAAYGSGILTWDVVKIDSKPIDKSNVNTSSNSSWRSRRYNYQNTDTQHANDNIPDIVTVSIKRRETKLPKDRRWCDEDRDLTYNSFKKGGYGPCYYKSKPHTVDDV